MKVQNKVRAVAGIFVFVSALLGFFHNKYWLLFTMFVGLNLLQYAFTNWCLMEELLKKIS